MALNVLGSGRAQYLAHKPGSQDFGLAEHLADPDTFFTVSYI
jgi:hypothetical protein